MTDTQGIDAKLMFILPNLRFNTRHFLQLVVTTATYTLARKLTLAYPRENIFVKLNAAYLVDMVKIHAVSVVLTESKIILNSKRT